MPTPSGSIPSGLGVLGLHLGVVEADAFLYLTPSTGTDAQLDAFLRYHDGSSVPLFSTNTTTILDGTGTPLSSQGLSGDYYIKNGSVPMLYGPKSGDAVSWGSGVSLVGPKGDQGDSNSTLYIGSSAPPTPSNGTLWLNSEYGSLYAYYNDGSSSQWIAPVGASSDNGLLKMGVFYVDDYGAVGDGTTDDRAAIQACCDAVEAIGGGTVMLGPKTYRIECIQVQATDTPTQSPGCIGIEVGSNTVFKGFGNNSVLKGTSASFRGTGGLINLKGFQTASVAYGAANNVRFEDFKVECPLTNPDVENAANEKDKSSGNIFNLVHGKLIYIKNVTIGESRYHALEINQCVDMLIENCYLYGGHTAIVQFDSGDAGPKSKIIANVPVRRITIKNCYFAKRPNSADGKDIDMTHANNHEVSDILFEGCVFESRESGTASRHVFNPSGGLTGSSVKRFTIRNNRFYMNSTHSACLFVAEAAGVGSGLAIEDLVFEGNYCEGPSRNFVVIGSSDPATYSQHDKRRGIKINNNNFIFNKSSFVAGTEFNLIYTYINSDINISNNLITLTGSFSSGVLGGSASSVIRCSRNIKTNIENNIIKNYGTNGPYIDTTYGILVDDRTQPVGTGTETILGITAPITSVVSNLIEDNASGFLYYFGLFANEGNQSTKISRLFASNNITTPNAPRASSRNYYIHSAITDGTNDARVVKWSESGVTILSGTIPFLNVYDDQWLDVTSAAPQPTRVTGLKIGRSVVGHYHGPKYQVTRKLGASNDNSAEPVLNTINNLGQSVGVYLTDYNPPLGTFNVQVGNGGVGYTVNSTGGVSYVTTNSIQLSVGI
jgi:polygalacturonase